MKTNQKDKSERLSTRRIVNTATQLGYSFETKTNSTISVRFGKNDPRKLKVVQPMGKTTPLFGKTENPSCMCDADISMH